jgi:hypothetical protein
MAWKLIGLSGDENTARMSATALMDKLGAAYRRAGLPAGVEVYRCRPIAHPPAYLLSQEAYDLLTANGGGFSAVDRTEPPEPDIFTRVEL